MQHPMQVKTLHAAKDCFVQLFCTTMSHIFSNLNLFFPGRPSAATSSSTDPSWQGYQRWRFRNSTTTLWNSSNMMKQWKGKGVGGRAGKLKLPAPWSYHANWRWYVKDVEEFNFLGNRQQDDEVHTWISSHCAMSSYLRMVVIQRIVMLESLASVTGSARCRLYKFTPLPVQSLKDKLWHLCTIRNKHCMQYAMWTSDLDLN